MYAEVRVAYICLIWHIAVHYETYAKLDSSKFTNNAAEIGEGKIYYTRMPVAGTMARGDELPFRYAMDKEEIRQIISHQNKCRILYRH